MHAGAQTAFKRALQESAKRSGSRPAHPPPGHLRAVVSASGAAAGRPRQCLVRPSRASLRFLPIPPPLARPSRVAFLKTSRAPADVLSSQDPTGSGRIRILRSRAHSFSSRPVKVEVERQSIRLISPCPGSLFSPLPESALVVRSALLNAVGATSRQADASRRSRVPRGQDARRSANRIQKGCLNH